MNFTIICMLCNKGERESIYLDAEPLKLHHLYFVAHVGVCISFLPEQRKYCEKLTHLFLLRFLIRTHSSHTLPSPC